MYGVRCIAVQGVSVAQNLKLTSVAYAIPDGLGGTTRSAALLQGWKSRVEAERELCIMG